MKRRIQFGKLLLALGICAGMVIPCAAQNRNKNRPPQQQREQRVPRQENRPPQRQGGAQRGRPSAGRPHNNMAPNRQSPSGQTESMGMIGGNRPPDARSEFGRQSNFNPNRPPKRYQDLTPQEKQSLEKFNRLPPQKQQEMRERAREWQKLTPQQQNHIRNDVLPVWKQLPSARQRAISNRLEVLKNMPESARNQHLNDPNFTRGMSEEDKALLRDLSHMHVGAPDPSGE